MTDTIPKIKITQKEFDEIYQMAKEEVTEESRQQTQEEIAEQKLNENIKEADELMTAEFLEGTDYEDV